MGNHNIHSTNQQYQNYYQNNASDNIITYPNHQIADPINNNFLINPIKIFQLKPSQQQQQQSSNHYNQYPNYTQYLAIFHNQNSFNLNTDIYKQRIIHSTGKSKHIVQLLHYQKLQKSSEIQCCQKQTFDYILKIQNTPLKLSNINQQSNLYLSFTQALYILVGSLKGFAQLSFTIKSTFKIKPEMIFLNNYGNVRVWLNQLLPSNYPQQTLQQKLLKVIKNSKGLLNSLTQNTIKDITNQLFSILLEKCCKKKIQQEDQHQFISQFQKFNHFKIQFEKNFHKINLGAVNIQDFQYYTKKINFAIHFAENYIQNSFLQYDFKSNRIGKEILLKINKNKIEQINQNNCDKWSCKLNKKSSSVDNQFRKRDKKSIKKINQNVINSNSKSNKKMNKQISIPKRRQQKHDTQLTFGKRIQQQNNIPQSKQYTSKALTLTTMQSKAQKMENQKNKLQNKVRAVSRQAIKLGNHNKKRTLSLTESKINFRYFTQKDRQNQTKNNQNVISNYVNKKQQLKQKTSKPSFYDKNYQNFKISNRKMNLNDKLISQRVKHLNLSKRQTFLNWNNAPKQRKMNINVINQSNNNYKNNENHSKLTSYAISSQPEQEIIQNINYHMRASRPKNQFIKIFEQTKGKNNSQEDEQEQVDIECLALQLKAILQDNSNLNQNQFRQFKKLSKLLLNASQIISEKSKEDIRPMKNGQYRPWIKNNQILNEKLTSRSEYSKQDKYKQMHSSIQHSQIKKSALQQKQLSSYHLSRLKKNSQKIVNRINKFSQKQKSKLKNGNVFKQINANKNFISSDSNQQSDSIINKLIFKEKTKHQQPSRDNQIKSQENNQPSSSISKKNAYQNQNDKLTDQNYQYLQLVNSNAQQQYKVLRNQVRNLLKSKQIHKSYYQISEAEKQKKTSKIQQIPSVSSNIVTYHMRTESGGISIEDRAQFKNNNELSINQSQKKQQNFNHQYIYNKGKEKNKKKRNIDGLLNKLYALNNNTTKSFYSKNDRIQDQCKFMQRQSFRQKSLNNEKKGDIKGKLVATQLKNMRFKSTISQSPFDLQD